MKIKQYEVLKYDSLNTLIKNVNVAISKGWQPIGGISASTKDSDVLYLGLFCQAMVLYDE